MPINSINSLPFGMFPTLVETFGDTLSVREDARDARIMTLQTNIANAIDDVIAAHELIDIQRAQIAEYQAQIDAMRVSIREMEPLASRAAELARELADEGRFADYFRDEAIECATQLACIDDLLNAIGIADGPTIERVSSFINLWLHAEARAQGLTDTSISTISGSPRCNAPASAGDAQNASRRGAG